MSEQGARGREDRGGPLEWRAPSKRLIRRREALADVLGLLELVEDRDGEVLAADQALALGVLEQVILAEAELAGALARLDRGGGRDRRPVEIGRRLDLLESQRRGLGGWRLDALLRHVIQMGAAILAQQAAGTDHEQAALDARLAHDVEHPADVVLVPLHRDDRRIVALDHFREPGPVAGAAGPDGHARARLDLLGIARDGGHRVAAPKRLVENSAANSAGGTDQDDIHSLVPIMRSRIAATVSVGASCGTLWPTFGIRRRSYGPVNFFALRSINDAGPTPSASPCKLMVGTPIAGWACSLASMPSSAGSPGA